jgi:hypothetical protein
LPTKATALFLIFCPFDAIGNMFRQVYSVRHLLPSGAFLFFFSCKMPIAGDPTLLDGADIGTVFEQKLYHRNGQTYSLARHTQRGAVSGNHVHERLLRRMLQNRQESLATEVKAQPWKQQSFPYCSNRNS